MAMNRNAGVTKVKLGSSTKKAAVKKATPKKAVAMKKAASTKTAVLKKAAPKKASAVQKAKLAPKKAGIKKAVGPKLTASQHGAAQACRRQQGRQGVPYREQTGAQGSRELAEAQGNQEGPEAPGDEVLSLSGFHNRQEVPGIGRRSQKLIRDSIVRQTIGASR